MNKTRVCAVLLAGGEGTRLWPLSTGSFSKSFVRIADKKPLVQRTIERLGGFIDKKDILIVVDKRQKPAVRKTVKGIPGKNILAEPFGRSTASASGLAAIALRPEDIMVVLPTDSLIKETPLFRNAVKKAVDFIRNTENVIVCFGIKPKGPSTAYGYIKVEPRGNRGIYPVDRFIEKPTETIAEKLVKKPVYLWNAGMFVFRAGDILNAMKKHAPVLHRELMRIKKDRKKKTAAYSRMRNVSIDYQVMEKAENLYCVKAGFNWQDLGNWENVGRMFSVLGGKKDKKGNVLFGKVRLLDTRGSVIYNSSRKRLALIGLKGMIVVHTENGTLVCRKKDAEKVKALAAGLNR